MRFTAPNGALEGQKNLRACASRDTFPRLSGRLAQW